MSRRAVGTGDLALLQGFCDLSQASILYAYFERSPRMRCSRQVFVNLTRLCSLNGAQGVGHFSGKPTRRPNVFRGPCFLQRYDSAPLSQVLLFASNSTAIGATERDADAGRRSHTGDRTFKSGANLDRTDERSDILRLWSTARMNSGLRCWVTAILVELWRAIHQDWPEQLQLALVLEDAAVRRFATAA
jgi:hypothetical protein